MSSLMAEGLSTVPEGTVKNLDETGLRESAFTGGEARRIWQANASAVVASREIVTALTRVAAAKFEGQGESVNLSWRQGETEEARLLLSFDGTKEKVIELVVRQGKKGSSLQLAEGRISPIFPLDSQRTADPQKADATLVDRPGGGFAFNFRTTTARLLGEEGGLFPSPLFQRTGRFFFLSYDSVRFQNREENPAQLKEQLRVLLAQLKQILSAESLDGKSNLLSFSLRKEGGEPEAEGSESPRPRPPRRVNLNRPVPVPVEAR